MGTKLNEALTVHCDFCGIKFKASHSFSRTCGKCRQKGAPDQSLDEDYDLRVRAWHEARGEDTRQGRRGKRREPAKR